MADLQESFWNNLLDYIQDRTVVPIVGSELVTIRESDRDVPLYRWLAQRLAADLGLPAAELAEGFDLNDVVSLHLRQRGEREELYAQIHRMLRNAALTPNESLRALAGIPATASQPFHPRTIAGDLVPEHPIGGDEIATELLREDDEHGVVHRHFMLDCKGQRLRQDLGPIGDPKGKGHKLGPYHSGLLLTNAFGPSTPDDVGELVEQRGRDLNSGAPFQELR